MSNTIPAWFSEQYHNVVETLYQQEGSVFRGKCREVTQMGKTQYFEQIGSIDAVKITSRHADTTIIENDHQRRQVTVNDYGQAAWIDPFDRDKMVVNPEASYVQAIVMALSRGIDDEFITATTGTAYADTTGAGSISSVSLPATQQVAVNLGGSNAGLTLAKLVKAKSILGKNEVPRGSKKYFSHRQQQLDDLLNNVSQVQSSDYNNVKALVDGEVNYFMGFEFVPSERLTNVTSTDVTSCLAWDYNAMLMSFAGDITTRVDERPDKNYQWQGYGKMQVGATRMQEKGVVEIYCDESP